MRFLKNRLIREIGWIAFLVSSETQNLMNLTIDPTADSSDSPRRLISLPDQRYFPLPWKRSAKYISGSFEFPKWNASPSSSSILYIGRIVVLRSLVTILFHPWAWIRGERFKFIRPRRRRKSWGTIDYEASRDFASNRGRAVEIKTSLAYRNWLETIAGNRDVPCVRLLNGRVVVPIDRKKIFRFA